MVRLGFAMVWVSACNGEVTETPTSSGCESPGTWYPDADGDGFGDTDGGVQACAAPAGSVADNTDCDDTDAAVRPGGTEVPCNDVDEDCIGGPDLGDAVVPGDYPTLQAALDAVDSGALVCLAAGTHDNALVLDRDPTFVATVRGAGRGQTVLTGSGGTHLLGGYLDLRDVTIRSSGDGLHVGPAGSGTLTSVDVDGAGTATWSWGYVLWVEGDLTATDLSVHDLALTGGWVDTAAMFSVGFAGTLTMSNLTVSDNVIDTSGTSAQYGVYEVWIDSWENDGVFATDGGTVDVTGGSIVRNTFLSSASQVYLLGYNVNGSVQGVEIADNVVTSSDDEAFFGYTGYGALLLSQSAIVDNTVTGPGTGLLFGEGASMSLRNVVIAGNTLAPGEANGVGGFILGVGYGSAQLTHVTIADNTVAANVETDGQLWGWGGTGWVVSGVAVADNQFPAGPLMTLIGGASVEADDSYFRGNSSHAIGGDLSGQFDPSAEAPGFVDASARDYHLAGGSPLIDAGPADLLDPDGTPSDIGAYGGPGGAW